MALKSSFVVQNSINYIYVMVLGASFVNMMVSASFMGDYAIWLLFGLAYAIKLNVIKEKNEKSENISFSNLL